MEITYPRPLRPGDTVAVTAPSSGVGEQHRARFDHAVAWLRRQGYEVELGACLDGSSHVSAPVAQRAAELERMLTDPRVRVVIPPWGGETAIDLLPHLDLEAIAAAEPTWMVGFSDISTILTPLTLLTGWATVHGTNLMDSPYEVPAPLLSWLDVVTAPAGSTLRQASPGVHRSSSWDDWTVDPTVSRHTWDGTGGWRRIDAGGASGSRAGGRATGGDGTRGAGTGAGAGAPDLDLTGRIIGGCIETQSGIAGSRNGRTAALSGGDGRSGQAGADGAARASGANGAAAAAGAAGTAAAAGTEGTTDQDGDLIVYVEASGEDALSICRRLHGMRLAGYFDGAVAVLVGRTKAPDSPTLTQTEAVLDALGSLGVPIIADVECGHVPPYLLLVNGALGRLVWSESERFIEQTLV